MVGLNPAIRDLCKNPKLLSSPTDPPDFLVPKFNDFSSSLNDPFPDFDSIEDWILEPDSLSALIEGNGAANPQLMSSEETHQEIVVENPSPDGPDSVRAEFGFPEGTHPCLDGSDSKPAEIGFSGETCLEVGSKDQCPAGSDLERAEFQFLNETCEDTNVEELHPDGSDLTNSGFGEPEKSALSSISIEEEMGKVSLVGACNVICVNSDVTSGEERDGLVKIDKCNGDAKSKENINVETRVTEKGVTEENRAEDGEMVSQRVGKNSSISESTESEDSSSSSSGEETDSDDSSDDDDDVEKEEEKESQEDEVVEVEEGEIRDFDREEIVVSSEDEEGGIMKGPVKSRNEIEILPPVPSVDVVLQPHHQMLPVGVVLTMMGAKVIVEGLEKHNPLNEGSILWITATRLPLGLVDEIFGPVKNPYYVVRFNSEKEVPSGIREGTAISFVAEFADHILNDKSLYKKGYDASGDNDEEISDEAEFSDDEKEAEYKRSLRVAKKGKDRRENRESDGQKRAQFKGRFHKNVQPSSSPAPVAAGPPAPMGMGVPFVPAQLQGPQIPGPFGCGSCGCSFGAGQVGSSGPTCVPQISNVAQTTGLGGPPQHLFLQSNAVWTNGMPAQQQHMGMLSGFQMNGVPHPQPPDHYHHQHQQQQQQQMFTGGSNGIPCQQQQFDPRQMPNLAGFMAPSCFNQVPFGMGIQGQQGHHLHTAINRQGVSGFEPFNGQLPPPITQGGFSAPRQFNPGSASNRGKKPYPRGGRGNFSGRRGWRPTGSAVQNVLD